MRPSSADATLRTRKRWVRTSMHLQTPHLFNKTQNLADQIQKLGLNLSLQKGITQTTNPCFLRSRTGQASQFQEQEPLQLELAEVTSRSTVGMLLASSLTSRKRCCLTASSKIRIQIRMQKMWGLRTTANWKAVANEIFTPKNTVVNFCLLLRGAATEESKILDSSWACMREIWPILQLRQRVIRGLGTWNANSWSWKTKKL